MTQLNDEVERLIHLAAAAGSPVPDRTAQYLRACFKHGDAPLIPPEESGLPPHRVRGAACTDLLTGLRDRQAFDEDFNLTLAHSARTGEAVHLLLLDLDDLKAVNDTQGHEQGDRLLRLFARTLHQEFPVPASVYRLGGDEFLVLLTGDQFVWSELRVTVQNINGHLRASGFQQARASVGHAAFPVDAGAPNDLLRLADHRMLRDKMAHRAKRGLSLSRGPVQAEAGITAEMMWQALRATSSLMSSDVPGEDIWTPFLRAVIAAVPSAEAGTLFVREGDAQVLQAQVGYSDALLGLRNPDATLRAWHGDDQDWAAGKARVIRGRDIEKWSVAIHQHSGSAALVDTYREHGSLSDVRASLSAPVVADGRVTALINLESLSSDQAFEAHEMRLAEEFAAQAGAILAVHHRRAREHARTRELEVLADANFALRHIHRQDELERRLVGESRALLATEHVAVARYDAARDALSLVAGSGAYAELEHIAIPRGTGLTWHAIDGAEVQIVQDVLGDARIHQLTHARAGAMLVAPLLRADGGPIGALLALREEPRTFTELDGRLLRALASAGALAFEHLWAVQQEQRHTQEFRMLADLSSQLSHSEDPMQIARESLASCRSFLGADAAVFNLPDRQAVIWDGTWPAGSAELLTRFTQAEGADSLIKLVGEAAFLTGTAGDFTGAAAWLAAAGLRGLVIVPVWERGVNVGTVAMLWTHALAELPPAGVPLTMRVAELIGRALDREAHIADIAATREGAMLALGLSLELRDFETAGHTERVVALALRLGQAVGLDHAALEGLRQGAYLHDIGKLAVPDHILLKPGPLDPAEWAIMKSHAGIADTLSRRIPTLPDEARQVIRHHHERWDGAGYPDGLAGADIPLVARIFAVVDTYDALTNQRPYKPAWSASEALSEIQRKSGEMFDPRIVKVFCALARASGLPPEHRAGAHYPQKETP
ncbi:HD domain-containing phosphohydrolase [Deinococcus malanensis]|uniref:HD domain-containing phosphohydrolase n=1 Tax=Deinococcus malanensis TaxID=1706855 RepID=UPI001662BB9E|nr:HD domain-containing phosphohydrolase [Deinococcus malanensis]